MLPEVFHEVLLIEVKGPEEILEGGVLIPQFHIYYAERDVEVGIPVVFEHFSPP